MVIVFFFPLETKSYYIAQAGLSLAVLLPQPPLGAECGPS